MYTIKIHTDNAAFHPYPGDEISRILIGVAKSLMHGHEGQIILRDDNGNKVGTAEFTPEEGDE